MLNRPEGNALIGSGLAVLALGAARELSIYLRGAWPTALTWIMMVAGLIVIAVGCGRKGAGPAYAARLIVGLFVMILRVLWASG